MVWGVHLRAYSAALLAGVVNEPSASPPIEIGLYPAATARVDPVDEPPGF